MEDIVILLLLYKTINYINTNVTIIIIISYLHTQYEHKRNDVI